jgi:hypothetical protein
MLARASLESRFDVVVQMPNDHLSHANSVRAKRVCNITISINVRNRMRDLPMRLAAQMTSDL